MPSTADQQDAADACCLTSAIESVFTVELGVGVGEADGLAGTLAVVGVALGDAEADVAEAVGAALELELTGAEQAVSGRANNRGTRTVLSARNEVMGVPFLAIGSA